MKSTNFPVERPYRLAAQGAQPTEKFVVFSFSNEEEGIVGRVLQNKDTGEVSLFLIAEDMKKARGRRVKLLDSNLEATTDSQGTAKFGKQADFKCSNVQIQSPLAMFDLTPHEMKKHQTSQSHSFLLKNAEHDEISIEIDKSTQHTSYRISIIKIKGTKGKKELRVVALTDKDRTLSKLTEEGLTVFETDGLIHLGWPPERIEQFLNIIRNFTSYASTQQMQRTLMKQTYFQFGLVVLIASSVFCITCSKKQEELSKISMKVTINTSADEVWKTVSDFNGWDKFIPVVASSSMEGAGVGAVRTLTTQDGGEIVERLETLDAQSLTLSYKILSSPLPLEYYLSTMRIHKLSENQCELEWDADFRPKGTTEAEAKKLIQDLYSASIEELKKLHEI